MRTILCGLICAGIISSAAAAPSTPESELRQFVDGVQTLSADFSQVQKDEQGSVIQEQSGHLWLQRPGRFRWAYRVPYEQLIVSDGQTIFLYDPDLAQVTERSASNAFAGTPAELLAQGGALDDSFTLEDAGSQCDTRGVRLLPKQQDGDFKSIELWLRSGTPVRLRFHDQLGGITDVMFQQVEVNQPIPAAQFRFTPPPGTEVIEAQ